MLSCFCADPPTGIPSLTPASPSYTEGDTAKLTCTLTQDGNPLATWSWSCPWRAIQSSEITNSAGKSVLQFTTNKDDNRRSCICRATSTIGSYDRMSNAVTLNVRCKFMVISPLLAGGNNHILVTIANYPHLCRWLNSSNFRNTQLAKNVHETVNLVDLSY